MVAPTGSENSSLNLLERSQDMIITEDKQPQIRKNTVEYEPAKPEAKFDLKDLKIQEDDTEIEFVGPVEWLVCSFRESEIQKEFRLSGIERDLKGLLFGL